MNVKVNTKIIKTFCAIVSLSSFYSNAQINMSNSRENLRSANFCQYFTLSINSNVFDAALFQESADQKLKAYALKTSPGEALSCLFAKYGSGNADIFVGIYLDTTKDNEKSAIVTLNALKFGSISFSDNIAPLWVGARKVKLDDSKQQSYSLLKAAIGELLDEVVAAFRSVNPEK